jgi:hypothetical protein
MMEITYNILLGIQPGGRIPSQTAPARLEGGIEFDMDGSELYCYNCDNDQSPDSDEGNALKKV